MCTTDSIFLPKDHLPQIFFLAALGAGMVSHWLMAIYYPKARDKLYIDWLEPPRADGASSVQQGPGQAPTREKGSLSLSLYVLTA